MQYGRMTRTSMEEAMIQINRRCAPTILCAACITLIRSILDIHSQTVHVIFSNTRVLIDQNTVKTTPTGTHNDSGVIIY